MTCRELSDFLRDAVAGELPADVQQEFERHVEACGNCGEFMHQYRVTVTVARTAFEEHIAVPDEVVEAILSAVRNARASGA
ncbi:MAG TPA: zf-HC2 domain-containing protein [Vicinamibacterales bacterium]|nr:zf-HC2 domain-containing protein [Vicinamibacterales bacterium]